jgi:hypothetical protein
MNEGSTMNGTMAARLEDGCGEEEDVCQLPMTFYAVSAILLIVISFCCSSSPIDLLDFMTSCFFTFPLSDLERNQQ